MQQLHTARQRKSLRASRLGWPIGSVVLALVLSACTSTASNAHDGAPGGGSSAAHAARPTSTTSSPTPPAAPRPAVITVATGARVNPAHPLTVGIRYGKLTDITMRNAAGRRVRGAISDDGLSWHNTEDLGYGKTYRITATGVDPNGKSVSKSSALTTLSPDLQTMPSLQRIGGYSLGSGATYGVAIVPVVHFDEPITDRAAVQRALTITTTPHVNGAWYWADDQNVHWRPEHYWPTGTAVTVSADLYGVRVGPGLYGQADRKTSFQIGRRQVTVARDTAPNSVNKVKVYNAAGKLIRTMNTSMGLHSGETVASNYINFYTLDGTYTVLGHEQPARMCSASYGLPVNAPGGYACEDIYNATKISTDGIYLHYLPATVWDQDHGQDVSHGCLNLNANNSLWFFNHSIVGDPVEINGAPGAPTLQIGQGGDWTIPWSVWVRGSVRN